MATDKKRRLPRDLDILLNYGREADGSRDGSETHDELVIISAKAEADAKVFIERSVCSDCIPAEVIGETVARVLQQIRAAGLDAIKQTVTITFETTAGVDGEGATD